MLAIRIFEGWWKWILIQIISDLCFFEFKLLLTDNGRLYLHGAMILELLLIESNVIKTVIWCYWKFRYAQLQAQCFHDGLKFKQMLVHYCIIALEYMEW